MNLLIDENIFQTKFIQQFVNDVCELKKISLINLQQFNLICKLLNKCCLSLKSLRFTYSFTSYDIKQFYRVLLNESSENLNELLQQDFKIIKLNFLLRTFILPKKFNKQIGESIKKVPIFDELSKQFLTINNNQEIEIYDQMYLSLVNSKYNVQNPFNQDDNDIEISKDFKWIDSINNYYFNSGIDVHEYQEDINLEDKFEIKRRKNYILQSTNLDNNHFFIQNIPINNNPFAFHNIDNPFGDHHNIHAENLAINFINNINNHNLHEINKINNNNSRMFNTYYNKQLSQILVHPQIDINNKEIDRYIISVNKYQSQIKNKFIKVSDNINTLLNQINNNNSQNINPFGWQNNNLFNNNNISFFNGPNIDNGIVLPSINTNFGFGLEILKLKLISFKDCNIFDNKTFQGKTSNTIIKQFEQSKEIDQTYRNKYKSFRILSKSLQISGLLMVQNQSITIECHKDIGQINLENSYFPITEEINLNNMQIDNSNTLFNRYKAKIINIKSCVLNQQGEFINTIKYNQNIQLDSISIINMKNIHLEIDNFYNLSQLQFSNISFKNLSIKKLINLKTLIIKESNLFKLNMKSIECQNLEVLTIQNGNLMQLENFDSKLQSKMKILEIVNENFLSTEYIKCNFDKSPKCFKLNQNESTFLHFQTMNQPTVFRFNNKFNLMDRIDIYKREISIIENLPDEKFIDYNPDILFTECVITPEKVPNPFSQVKKEEIINLSELLQNMFYQRNKGKNQSIEYNYDQERMYQQFKKNKSKFKDQLSITFNDEIQNQKNKELRGVQFENIRKVDWDTFIDKLSVKEFQVNCQNGEFKDDGFGTEQQQTNTNDSQNIQDYQTQIICQFDN